MVKNSSPKIDRTSCIFDFSTCQLDFTKNPLFEGCLLSRTITNNNLDLDLGSLTTGIAPSVQPDSRPNWDPVNGGKVERPVLVVVISV